MASWGTWLHAAPQTHQISRLDMCISPYANDTRGTGWEEGKEKREP